MIQDFSIFATYILVPISGNSEAIHCNYIQRLPIETDNLSIQEVLMNFSGGTTGATAGFKFLNSSITGSTAGTGFTANKIYALIQTGLTNLTGTTTPDPALWKMYDLTSQITKPTPHIAGQPLTAKELTQNNFKIPLSDYNTTGFTAYTLTYLNYPTNLPADADKLSFGDEKYFMGNVSGEIHADVFVTDLSIVLNLNEFNSSTNLTWDGVSKVAITEIGVYDANMNLVAIGKLNDPIVKDSTISRTIVFDIDF
jgi:hypothetical protein